VDRATRRETSWRRQVNDLTDVAAERRIVGLSQGDEQDLFRTRLLQWHLERLKGRTEAPVEPPRAPMSWLPLEPWFAARALPAGPTRSTAMLLALDDEPVADRPERVALAGRLAYEELAAANAPGAAALAERLDLLDPSVDRLALRAWALAQAGRAPDAEALLRTRQSEAADGPDEARLRVLGARIALARGDDLAARARLGAALALGSPDAAVLSARLLLASGEGRRARTLARAWIDAPDTRDASAALWALACLAEAPGPSSPEAPPRAGAPVR